MKPDLYTKAVLTIIAIMLTAIASRQFINPTGIVNAQSGHAPFLFSAGEANSTFYFYDAQNEMIRVVTQDGKTKPSITLR
jgi:hypothetical protein